MTPRERSPLLLGALGCGAAAVGYGLEAFRQRGDCDLGDASPDTLALSVVLILLVGGGAGLGGLVAAGWRVLRHGSSKLRVLGVATSALSCAAAVLLVALAGNGPATWFQYCAT